jgi:hypothetical protein
MYPDALRRVSYLDAETNKRFKFLTNSFTLPAVTIAQIYKSRWQVELFFKRIKQHLRIEAFYGTSENAVKTQIWIAVSIYVLVAIIRKRLMLPLSRPTPGKIHSIIPTSRACSPYSRTAVLRNNAPESQIRCLADRLIRAPRGNHVVPT